MATSWRCTRSSRIAATLEPEAGILNLPDLMWGIISLGSVAFGYWRGGVVLGERKSSARRAEFGLRGFEIGNAVFLVTLFFLVAAGVMSGEAAWAGSADAILLFSIATILHGFVYFRPRRRDTPEKTGDPSTRDDG